MLIIFLNFFYKKRDYWKIRVFPIEYGIKTEHEPTNYIRNAEIYNRRNSNGSKSCGINHRDRIHNDEKATTNRGRPSVRHNANEGRCTLH